MRDMFIIIIFILCVATLGIYERTRPKLKYHSIKKEQLINRMVRIQQVEIDNLIKEAFNKKKEVLYD